jgi:ABC-type multidrug transport system ATPase subunit
MDIHIENVAKKYNKEWIFRNVNIKISHQQSTAITGPNGSGKSTLLQIIAGSLLQTEGNIKYQHEGAEIKPEHIYKYLSLVAPAMALPEDFTLREFIDFHFKFKKLKNNISPVDLPAIFKLEKALNKYIKNFSTGMKQRVKLGVAFYTDTPMLLLDEPATNLDKAGIDWYMEEVEKVIEEKMIFVCSNRKDEYSFCSNFIDILAYKK